MFDEHVLVEGRQLRKCPMDSRWAGSDSGRTSCRDDERIAVSRVAQSICPWPEICAHQLARNSCSHGAASRAASLRRCGDARGSWTIQDVIAKKASDDFKQRLIANVWQNEDFYRERHISLDMVNKPPAEIQRRLDAGQLVFWPWSITKLRSFSVEGIISENDPDAAIPKDYAGTCLAQGNVAVRSRAGMRRHAWHTHSVSTSEVHVFDASTMHLRHAAKGRIG